MHVNVIIAIKDGRVAECIVTEDKKLGDSLFKRLREIYGGANVALWSRRIDEVPVSLWAGYGEENDCT